MPRDRERARSPTSPAGNLRANELERAKENLKGRIVLSMEATSNRMSRLGKSLITDTELLSLDRIIAEIDAVQPENVAELAELLLAPERLSAAGIGPDEERFLAGARARQPRRSSRPPPSVTVALLGTWRQGRAACCCPRSRRPGTRSTPIGSEDSVEVRGLDAAIDFTRPDAVFSDGSQLPRAGRARASSGRPGSAARSSSTWASSRDERSLALFVAPNFAIGAVLMMRLAAEAARWLPRAEIVELHHESKVDAPSGTAKATAERAAGQARDPLGSPSGARGAPGGADGR